MKRLVLLVLLPLFLLALMALFPASSPSAGPQASPAVLSSAPAAGTAEPTRERAYRPYPAPTGQAGFRRYYQIRCYPGCHYGSTSTSTEPTPMVQPTVTPNPVGTRAYRPYPAPTGQAGFRRYYQIRCYPGCHTSPTSNPPPVHP